MIDGIISKLTGYNDLTLRNELKDNPEGNVRRWSINISIADDLTKTAGRRVYQYLLI